MNYFSDCNSPDEIRTKYRNLVKKHHPDLGGDTKTMQEINTAYEIALKRMDGRKFTRTSSTDSTNPDSEKTKWEYHYNAAREAEIAETISRIVAIVGPACDIDVYIVGLWIWIVGNTRPYRKELKAMGCWWNEKRTAWTWKPAGVRSRYNPKKTLDEILAEGMRVNRNQSAQETLRA